MNGKMLLKVTLNEAIDPELFEYLAQFDNARLRVGAFRALASIAARSKHVIDSGHQFVEAPIPTKTDAAIEIENNSVPVSSFHTKPPTTDSAPQYLDDEIGDQFARF
jgi:hypothetical protein